MSMQRLTLGLPSGAKTQRTRRLWRPVSRVQPNDTVDVTSIARLSHGGRWRTEAMRSYERPVLLWFTRGQGRISIAGRSGGWSAHSAVYLPPGTMHGFSTTTSVLGSLVKLTTDDTHLWPSEPTHLRIREVRLQRELTGLIDAIEKEIETEADFANSAVRHHAGLLGIWFARTTEALAKSIPGEETAAHRLVEAYTALVERDFRSPVGVSYFASKLGVTPTHLSRACRGVSGRAALDILKERRHFEACHLLSETEIPMREVASQAGFASPAYFTRAFRAKTGKSPTEFRHKR